jgi:ferredoxin
LLRLFDCYARDVATCRVTFARPDGTILGAYDVRPGATLMRAILRGRLPLARSCRGTAICAACRVRILDGTPAPPSAAESTLAAREPLRPGERYACQTRVTGPITISTTYW